MNLRTAKALTPREYHARRNAEQLRQRENLRQRELERARRAILSVAPLHPAILTVHLFGSVLRPGRFREGSDIDIAIECDDLAAETPFARALEDALGRAVDLRPLVGRIAEEVEIDGEKVYG